MVIAAHPDDADFGPAGTAARWIDAGSVGWLVCCTSGDQGGEDPDADPLELAALREREQRPRPRSSATPASPSCTSPTARSPTTSRCASMLVREIRTFRPDAVLATDPETLFYGDGGVNHTDHRAAGLAAVDAVYPAARNPMAFPSLARGGLAAHAVRRLYLFWSNHANAWVDISATLDRKLAALRAHASQIRDPDGLAERIRDWAAEEGSPIGVAAAEALRVVIIDEDDDEADPEASSGRRLNRGAQASSSSSGRTRPQSFHTSASPSARRPSIATSSPERQVAGRAGQVLVGGDRDVREEARPSRPRSASGGCASGRARRSRAPATGRAATARARRPSRPARRSGTRATTARRRCRGPGRCVNGPQNGCSGGKSRADASMRVGDDRIDQVGERDLPAPPFRGVVARQGRDELGHGAPVAAQQPEDARRAAAAERPRSAARRRTVAAGCARRRSLGRWPRPAGGLLLAVGDRSRGREAGRLGRLGRDPGRVGLEGQPLQLRRRRPRPPRAREPATAVASRASALMRLIS